MKQLSAIVIFLFTALTIYAQQYSNDVTITVNGSKNLQIAVDGRNYDLTNSTLKGEKQALRLTTLLLDSIVYRLAVQIPMQTTQKGYQPYLT
ncbi:MAG: hypothetical protein IPI54_16170 [Chitinophagaceae bacterium]|nr:hypothetical protein [Chitinophagaceae bacterium]